MFIQERYGHFNLSDPFLALQRDFEASAGDKERRSLCSSPLSVLEAVMAHCRKMQERMSVQLEAAEGRQKKVGLDVRLFMLCDSALIKMWDSEHVIRCSMWTGLRRLRLSSELLA